MKLLQVCNVGNIVGGTAACAWTVMRALPDFDHHIIFRSTRTEETMQAFSKAETSRCAYLTRKEIKKIEPDLILLHNLHNKHCEWGTELPDNSMPVIQYAHSAITHAGAHLTVACSKHLANQLSEDLVKILYQAVPIAAGLDSVIDRLGCSKLHVGRICTPTARKWPEGLIPFYQKLAVQFPQIHWEFVGCPSSMQKILKNACDGRVTFHQANWQARSQLRNWHALLYHHPHLSETFGRTVAEAMRTGCVPIVDEQGGFCEQIINQTGFLCRNHNDFSEALNSLTNRELWQKRSRNCQNHANHQFSIQEFRARLLKIFRQALQML